MIIDYKTQQNTKKHERIGVLFVHGIGQQGRFQHLESEVRNLASAIELAAGGQDARATVEINTGSSCSFSSPYESWRSDNEPCLEIIVKINNNLKVIGFHEVWWADLGEPSSIWNHIKFWLWGLSFWSLAHYDKDDVYFPPNEQMEMPKTDDNQPDVQKVRIKDRISLFLISLVFAIATGSITLVNIILKFFGLKKLLGSRTIVSYIGDVKLYRQHQPSKHGPINNVGQPTRVAIRRRMICAVADMATGGYSRWYILAHSLGSVVAFNALMEPAHALPNYLDRSRLMRLKEEKIAGPGRPRDLIGSKKNPETGLPDTNRMFPPRAAWLEDDEVVYRDCLFEGLRGFVTYGSPLDKYAALWPALVPINRVKVFQPEFEWVNIHDPTDPVGGQLDYFDKYSAIPSGGNLKELRPHNRGYRASPILLLSHIKYLKYRGRDTATASNAIAKWIIKGDSEFRPCGRRWIASNEGGRRSWSACLQWFVAAFLLGMITVISIRKISPVLLPKSVLEMFNWLPQLAHSHAQTIHGILCATFSVFCSATNSLPNNIMLHVIYVVYLYSIGILIVFIFGAVGRLLLPKKLPEPKKSCDGEAKLENINIGRKIWQKE